jgi:hypothetical protein
LFFINVNYFEKNKRGGNISIKKKRKKEKEILEKKEEKITKKRLKRNGSIEGLLWRHTDKIEPNQQSDKTNAS